jgi:WD40 repeat protein
MRGLIGVGVILWALLGAGFAEGREWVSRDGRFTVDAELLNVDGEQVVLRREDGPVIRVPLERLSLGDVKYVREALLAAGLTTPAPAAPAESATLAPETAAAEASPRATDTQAASEPQGPPLAQPGRVQWQAAPDPAPQGFDLKPGATVEIALPVRYSRPFVLFPSSQSPFVLLGSEESRGERQLWDLRGQKAIGRIDKEDAEFNANDRLALSCDGRLLAYHNYTTRGEVRIWSFPDRKIMQTLKMPKQHSNVMFLSFAGPERVIVGESAEDTYLVYDVKSGRQSGTIEVKPAYAKECQAVSPGGNYLVVHSGGDQPLAIYDTRNGVRAGRLRTKAESYVRPEYLVFSADGKELAGCFREGLGILIQVWDMTDGNSAATHLLADDPDRTLGHVSYRGGRLQWLADRSGWLLSGVAVLDRPSGKIVWRDQEAIHGREVLPRRIVDADRMLAFRKGEGEQTLCLVPIPKDQIARSREIVAAGGTAADTGLPPVVKTEMHGAKELALSRASWNYRSTVSSLPPTAALRSRTSLGGGPFDTARAFFSRPDAARLAIGRNVEASKAPWNALSPLPQACHLYDLQSGEQLAQFDVPFPTEFMDLSPEGKLGLFCIDRSKDRLDIWDLTNGQHALGFRPFDGTGGRNRQVAWAGFIHEDHVVTLSDAGTFVAWKLPECRAVYRSEPGYCRIAGMTRDRRAMVVVSEKTPHFVNPMSGDLLGCLPEIETEGHVILPRASFSCDENRLAILSTREEGSLLAAWDLTRGSTLSTLELPFRTYGLIWCGTDHVLLNRSAGSEDPDVLVDVVRGCVVWNYGVARGSSLRSSPDGRAWFVPRSSQASDLLAAELPDKEVLSLLSRLQFPDPLIGPSAAVTVQMQIENPPQAIPPGWADLEKLNEGLYLHFSKQLKDRRVDVVDRSDVRLIVGIEQRKVEETMGVRRLFGPSEQILISATLVIPYVVVLDSSGNRVWSKFPSENDLKPVDLDDCPNGVDKETFMKIHQWEQAAVWLRSVKIPYPLFHPSVHRGFGESLVTPQGTQIRRSPSPVQIKPQNKTARVSCGGTAA